MKNALLKACNDNHIIDCSEPYNCEFVGNEVIKEKLKLLKLIISLTSVKQKYF